MNKDLNSKRGNQRPGSASISAPPVTPAMFIKSRTQLQLASLGLHLYSKWIPIIWPSLQNCSFVEHYCAGFSSRIPLQQTVSWCLVRSSSSSRFSRRPPDIYSSWIWLNFSQRSVVWIIYSSISWILLSSNLLSDLLQMLSCLPGVISAGILTLLIWLIGSVW